MQATVLDTDTRRQLLARLRRLTPDTPARWGRMSAPRMVAHLGDQMRATLGDIQVAPRSRWMSLPLIKPLLLEWLPWPRGRVKGPPEAFQTPPGPLRADLDTLEQLVDRFVTDRERTAWPEHCFFGPMSREAWGRFCFRHFDHHLRQFGV